MRNAFHAELDTLADGLLEMCQQVSSAMTRATTALLEADLVAAESVISDDKAIDVLRERLDEQCFELLARQQPVATDLRVIVTAMRMTADIERMGDLARHIAKVARLRHPASAVPSDLHEVFRAMGDVAHAMVEQVMAIVAERDVRSARDIENEDDAMDLLHRDLFRRLNDSTWTHGTEAAVDIVLLGRYYERFGDHAVSVARRVVYVATGAYDPPAA